MHSVGWYCNADTGFFSLGIAGCVIVVAFLYHIRSIVYIGANLYERIPREISSFAKHEVYYSTFWFSLP